MRQAREDQKQSQFSERAVADGGGKSELISDLLQDIEQAEDGAEGRFSSKGGIIKLPAQGAAESLDARRRPMGKARVRFLTLPFSRKASRRRMAGGELRLGMVAMYMPTRYNNESTV
jgi:hypothetical protein